MMNYYHCTICFFRSRIASKYKSEGEIYDIHDVAESVSEVLRDDGYFKQDKDGDSITFHYLENYLGGEGWDEQYLTGEADDDY